jgi:hypothetical protein
MAKEITVTVTDEDGTILDWTTIELDYAASFIAFRQIRSGNDAKVTEETLKVQ